MNERLAKLAKSGCIGLWRRDGSTRRRNRFSSDPKLTLYYLPDAEHRESGIIVRREADDAFLVLLDRDAVEKLMAITAALEVEDVEYLHEVIEVDLAKRCACA